MSETKFTKGEWVADIRGGCCAVYEKSRENDTLGCHQYDDRNIFYSRKGAKITESPFSHWEQPEEQVANAHLIAAAPEMYAMLHEISEMNSHELSVFFESSSDIDDLLAKARGEA